MNTKWSARRETFRLKIRNSVYLPLTRGARVKGLNVPKFTIISNNCWGGTVYESYGLRKETPTVGMFIMPSDYIRFCANLSHYLELPLEFIDPEESRWKHELEMKENWGTYLIGKLDDIELHMLHHHDKVTALKKWNSRVKRVRYDKLIFKFNDQNGATLDELKAFDSLPLDNKVIFTAHAHPEIACCREIHCPRNSSYIQASWEPIGRNRSFDVTKYINDCFGF